MKVLHVIDSFSFGGAERLLATLNRRAPDAGLDLTVASLAPHSVERTASLDLLERAGLRPTFVGVRRLADPTAVPRLRRAMKQSGCDVVHAHLGYSAALVPPAARISGVPCVSTLHHVPAPGGSRGDRLKEWLWTRSAERGAALVFVSRAAFDATAELFGPARPSWRVLHNGVDLSAFTPRAGTTRPPLPADLLVPPGVPVVSVVAAVRAPKGHEVALRAWPRVRAAVPDAVLLVVGDGPHLEALRPLAGDGVVFAGAREDVPDILRASSLALSPSLTEALPTALIEAAACGLPVVATSVGGTPEVVDHGRTGLLVPPGDADALAAAVVQLLGDPEQGRRFGQAGRALAEERFGIDGWARALHDLYDEALTGAAR